MSLLRNDHVPCTKQNANHLQYAIAFAVGSHVKPTQFEYCLFFTFSFLSVFFLRHFSLLFVTISFLQSTVDGVDARYQR